MTRGQPGSQTSVTMKAALPQTLKTERDRFLGFAFASADLLLEVTQDGTILRADGAARTLTGRTESDLRGTRIADLMAEADRRAVVNALHHARHVQRLRPFAATIVGNGTAEPVLMGLYHSPGTVTFQMTVTRMPAPETLGGRDNSSGLLQGNQFLQEVTRALDPLPGEDTPVNRVLTLLHLEGLSSVRAKAPQKVDDFLKRFGSVLRQHAVGEAAGRVGDDKYGIVTSEQSAGLIAGLQTMMPGGIKVSAVDVDLKDQEKMRSEDSARALAYTIRRFADPDQPFAISNLMDGFQGMLEKTVTRIQDLRSAMETGLELAYQPIVGLKDRQVHHHEVLMRITGRDTQRTVLFAEDSGIVSDLDLAVLRMVMERLKKAPRLRAAVNVSARSLGSDFFVEAFERIVASDLLIARRILIEVTETVRIDDLKRMAGILNGFKSRGHKICLDDFGVGSASFPYLKALPIDYVKIDGSYADGLPGSGFDRNIVRCVVQLCAGQGIRTVVERVEREEQAACLADLGVDLGQGWLFGKPKPDPEG